jgi:hypothetical protein
MLQRTYREALAWAQLAKSPLRCDNINTFHGVIFIGSDVIKDVVDTSIPSIVTDFVRYDAIEYTISRNFTNRLEIVRAILIGIGVGEADFNERFDNWPMECRTCTL